ncbi:MAG: hypothetical protein ACR2NZ_00205 [Rubripirellula sp.]
MSCRESYPEGAKMKIATSLTLWMLLVAFAYGQQEFELIEPTGQVSATAELQRGRLLVYGQNGQRLYFSRDAQYDSTDGQFAGYFSVEINRALRFPRSGSGVMQTASLNDPRPRFRNSRRIVRAIGRHGAIAAPLPIVPPPIIAGRVTTPYGDPFAYGYPVPVPLAQSVLIDSSIVPNPPLPPARVELRNDGPREVQVGVMDLQNPSGNQSMRIRPGEAAEVQLMRDSGGQRIEHYRVVNSFGQSVTREIVTAVVPATRYEIVVHEWAMQSVAIDRTGKSPNVIEDINFQGRGIGRFLLPAGPALQSGVIGVYSAAASQGNAGTVQPIVPTEDLPVRGNNARRLEDAVLEAQRAAQRRASGR